ncbi:MAG: DNA repair protein RecO [Candidatus Andersenbacteria bacterium]|nr:DNA repair protein RecO [Candidatus Andersenbacteria bacterium]
MKGRQKLEALVLARRNSGEADQLVTFFTREHGLVRALAKGVRKIPSRRGGHLEPFTFVLTLLTTSRAGSYVGAVETLDHLGELKAEAASLRIASHIAATIMGLFEEGDVQAELFDAFFEACRMLPMLDEAKAHLLEATLMSFALTRAGLKPDLTACRQCGVRQPAESIVLDAYQGGWRCLLCHGGFSGTRYSLSPTLLKVLRFIQTNPSQALRVRLPQDQAAQMIAGVRAYVAAVTQQPMLSEAAAFSS